MLSFRIIIALNIEVLPNGPDMHKIGSPANLEAELMQANEPGSSSEQQNGQQQLFVQGQPQQSPSVKETFGNGSSSAVKINSTSAASNNVYAEANLFPIKSLNPYQNR